MQSSLGGGGHTCVQPTYTRQGMNRLLDLIIPSYEALIVKEGGGGDGNSYIPPATSLCSSSSIQSLQVTVSEITVGLTAVCQNRGVSVSKVVRYQVQGSTVRTQRAMGCSITSTARALPRTRHILNPVGSHWTMCLPWYNGTTASSDAAETHRVYASHTHHAHISAHAHTRLIMVSSVDSLCLQKIDTYTALSILV